MARALILTYHAVEAGPGPLCIDPELFKAHADVIAGSGARCLTIRGLADALRAGSLDDDAIVVTFDDGFASAVEAAVPLLDQRGLTATLFCVAGHLGGANDWPSAHDGGYRSRLAGAGDLKKLAVAGFEIGSHGMKHAPLAGAPEPVLRREVIDSGRALEDALETEVTSYAFPYGGLPGSRGRELVGETYGAACTTSLRPVAPGADLYALPRIDAHYVRSPELLRRALEGRLGGYLRARSLAARARRAVVKDYEEADATSHSLSE